MLVLVLTMKLSTNKSKARLGRQDRYGNTALHTACEEERPEVCQLLISHGASRDLANSEEKTPLELCSPQFARSLKS